MVGQSDQIHLGHIKVTDFFPYSRTESCSGWSLPPEAGLGGLATAGGHCEPSLLTNRTDAHLLQGVTEVSCRVCRESPQESGGRFSCTASVLGQPSLVFGFLSFPLTQLLGRREIL